MGNKYAEVTYNRDKDEMYVDIYQKISNTKISADEFNFEAQITFLYNMEMNKK